MNQNSESTNSESHTKKASNEASHGGGCDNPSCCPPAMPVKRSAPKIGRNDPCPCDSGRKFKKCCG